jgi:hypothetical protein
MKKAILEIYALVVCFAAMAVFVVYFGSGLYNVVRVAAPQLTLPSAEQREFVDNDQFCTGGNEACYTGDDPPQRLPEDQITKMRENNFAVSLRGEQQDAENFLVWVVIFIPISIVIFLAHWRIAKKARER